MVIAILQSLNLCLSMPQIRLVQGEVPVSGACVIQGGSVERALQYRAMLQMGWGVSEGERA
jgi:hypothetical protein